MIPVYFVSFNVMTVLKFWGDDALSYSDEFLFRGVEYDGTAFRVQPGQREMRFSNLNFILPFGGQLFRVPPGNAEILNALQMYFKYAFWSDFNPGFSYSTHIIHDKVSIKYKVGVSKSLALIRNVKSGWRTRWNGRTLISQSADVTTLRPIGKRLQIDNHPHVYLPEDIAASIDKQVAEGAHFFNCIILELSTPERRDSPLELLSVIPESGGTNVELAKTILPMQLMHEYATTSSPTLVGRSEEIFRILNAHLAYTSKIIPLPHTIGDELYRSSQEFFQKALDELFPVFIASKEGNVYYSHPLLCSLLFENELTDLLRPENGEPLCDLLKLLDEMRQKRFWEFYNTPIVKRFKRSPPEVLATLGRLRQQIMLLKEWQETSSSSYVGQKP